jgi:type I restriction enzyme S subunit
MNLANLEPFAERGWKLSSVGAAAEIQNNLRFPISEGERQKISGTYPYFGPTGILAHINEYRIEGENVLIGEDGDHFLKSREKPMTLLVSGQYNVNNHAHVMCGTTKCATKWLHYFFMHADLTPFLTRQGVGRFKLTKEALSKTPILLPPLPEQRKIADILTTWDEALTQLDALIEAQERRKKALMQQLLTGRRRLPGFSDKWKTRQFSDFLQESRIPVSKNDPSRRITVCLHLNGVEARSIRTESLDSTVYYKRRAKQFIYGKQNIHKGAIGIIPASLDHYHSTQDVPAFDFTGNCDPTWFFYLVARPSFYAGLETRMKGTGSKRLAPSAFLELETTTPSLLEQRAIATILDTADKQLTLLRTQRNALDQQKRGLMQRLLTGKLRIQLNKK